MNIAKRRAARPQIRYIITLHTKLPQVSRCWGTFRWPNIPVNAHPGGLIPTKTALSGGPSAWTAARS